MILFFSIFFILYSAINYYIFIRGWQALIAFPHLRIFYLVTFLIASFSYILAKFLSKFIPPLVYDIMMWIGSFWFSFMVYFLLSVLFIDILRLINSQLPFFPHFIKNNYLITKQITLLVVLGFVTGINIFGFMNTRNLQYKTLNIDLPKGPGNLNELNAVIVSDVHISPVNDGKLLDRIADKINDLKPDIVFIAGDLVDDNASVLRSRHIGSSLLKIKPKYGVYASTGNHEFINGADSCVKYMKELGLNVLRDSSVLIDNSFYVVGREDRSKKQFTGTDRKSLKDILKDVNTDYPIISMDHTPMQLDEANENGVALQLSGHTHHGQMFPANLITKMIYEIDWGYLKKSFTQYYVSCGVGTWGPPVRTASNSEIVNLKIRFID